MGNKLAIIGAGPGGLYAAREAALGGFNVTVFNNGRVGEGIACAEGFFDVLKLLEPPEAGVCFQIKEADLAAIDTFTVDCSQLNMWMIDRIVWQKHLARQVSKLGCEIWEGRPLQPVDLKKLEWDYDWVIDASGVNPLTQKVLKLAPLHFANTAQVTLEGDFSGFINKVKIAADSRFCGYWWIFPKSTTVANVGVGWFGNRQMGLRIRDVLQEVLQKECLESYQVLSAAGGLIPVERSKKLVYGNTLLVGDAAGLASPLHGGGIDTACISGTLAARAIVAGDPQMYEKSVERVLGLRLRLENKARKAWQKMDLAEINEFLAFCINSGKKELSLDTIRRSVTQQREIFQYIQSGQVRADWEQGMILNELPFWAQVLIRTI